MNKLITRALLAVTAFAALPSVAFAQQQITDLDGIINLAGRLGNALIPIFISFAVIYLVYAIVVYIIAGDDDKKKEGRTKVIYGVIGLFLILSIWGLVNILRGTLRTSNNMPSRSELPQVLPLDRVNN